MKPAEYATLRKTLGSQGKVARMLGVTRETLNKRERVGVAISREAELALRALAAMEPEDREPPAPKAVRRVSVMQVLFGRALEEARTAKRRERLMLLDLTGRPGVCRPVRGPRLDGGQVSPRWTFWIKSASERKKTAENVTVIACALRAAGQLEAAKEAAKKQKNKKTK